jgi:hypothetical protein
MSSLDLHNPQGGRAVGKVSVTSTGSGSYIVFFQVTQISDTRIRVTLDSQGASQNAAAATATATWVLPAGTLPAQFVGNPAATSTTRNSIISVNSVLVNASLLFTPSTQTFVATFTPAIGNPVSVPKQSFEYDTLY